MKVLDLFAGLCGWSAPFAARGHEVFSVDLDERFDVSLHADILTLTADDLPWKPDIILASPPCEAFSVMTIGRNWTREHTPKTDKARLAIALVEATRRLIDDLAPAYFVIENPRAKLRKLPMLADLDRRTVTYCQYGEPFMKPATASSASLPPVVTLSGTPPGVAGDTALTTVRPSWRPEVAAGGVPAEVRTRIVAEMVAAQVNGTASWYCGNGSACTRGYGPNDLVGAIDRKDSPYRKGDRVLVRSGNRSVVVTIVDTCLCKGNRVIDLSSGAFSRLADLSRGVIAVTLGPVPTLPETDTP